MTSEVSSVERGSLRAESTHADDKEASLFGRLAYADKGTQAYADKGTQAKPHNHRHAAAQTELEPLRTGVHVQTDDWPPAATMPGAWGGEKSLSSRLATDPVNGRLLDAAAATAHWRILMLRLEVEDALKKLVHRLTGKTWDHHDALKKAFPDDDAAGRPSANTDPTPRAVEEGRGAPQMSPKAAGKQPESRVGGPPVVKPRPRSNSV